MNRNDVIDVLSVVAAASRRTIGETDVDVWQAVIGEDDKQLALKAVRDHLAECPGVWLEPGHVHQRCRTYRRDMLEKEHTKRILDEGCAARTLAIEQANRDRIEELTAEIGRPDYTRPSQVHGINPLSVDCPYEACRAKTGYVCTNSSYKGGKPRKDPHPGRIDAAAAAARDAS
jgi:hypothetical protein